MPRNGSGTYSLPAGNPVVSGTTISSTVHNNTMTDIGSEITNSLDKDGQTVVAGTIDFNANKLILDGDGDTSIHASTDDVIDVEIKGTDAIKLGWQSVADTGFVTVNPAAFTADATENTHRLAVLNTNAITVPTGTTALASSVYITEPNITATGTVTAAATVYIAGAPTEGASNYSLFVDAGNVRFDGDLDVDGTANLDVVDIDGAVDMASTLQVDGAATFTTKITANGGIALADNDKATFGTGNDLEIYHDASNSYITDVGTGNLKIGGANVEITTAGGTQYFQGAANVAKLFHTGNERLATSSSGITVGGTVTATGTSVFASLDISGDIDVDGTTNLDVVDIDGAVNMATTALVTGVLTTTATQVATGGITSGSNIISDTDSTDSLGSTTVRWLKGWFDTLTAGTLTAGSGSITDSSGAISFGNENLSTTGTLASGAIGVTGNVSLATTSKYILDSNAASDSYLWASANDTVELWSGAKAFTSTSGNLAIHNTITSDLRVNYGTKYILDANASGDSYLWASANDTVELWAGAKAITAIGANVTSHGNLTVSGALSKGSGSFRIDHPLKPETHQLVHSFTESPQADLLYSGSSVLINGAAEINLDEFHNMTEGTFVALNRNVRVFTTNETDWEPIKGSVAGNILSISCQDASCSDRVSWLVIGERQDQHIMDIDWTDDNGRVIVEPLKPEAPL